MHKYFRQETLCRIPFLFLLAKERQAGTSLRFSYKIWVSTLPLGLWINCLANVWLHLLSRVYELWSVELVSHVITRAPDPPRAHWERLQTPASLRPWVGLHGYGWLDVSKGNKGFYVFFIGGLGLPVYNIATLKSKTGGGVGQRKECDVEGGKK